MNHSRAPGRRCSGMTVTPVAPAAAIAPSAASRSALPVGQPGQHRRQEDPAGQPGVRDRPHQVEPGPRGRHARLERGVQVVVPDGHRHPETDRDTAGGLRQQRDVPAQQGAFRQDGERRARVRQGADDAGHELVAALGPLVRVGVRAQRDVLVLPGRSSQLFAQHVDEVGLDDDLAVEVVTGVQFQPFMRFTSKAINARMTASAIWIDGIREWHRRFARHVVQRALRPHLVERQPGELRHLHAAQQAADRWACRAASKASSTSSRCASHRMSPCEHTFEQMSSQAAREMSARTRTTSAASAEPATRGTARR